MGRTYLRDDGPTPAEIAAERAAAAKEAREARIAETQRKLREATDKLAAEMKAANQK